MIRTQARAVIPAPPSGVYALLTDPARAVELGRHPVEVLSVEEHADGRRISRLRTRLPSGAAVESESTVLERVPDQRIVVVSRIDRFGFAPTRRGRFGRLTSRMERTLEAHPGGTLVRVRAEFRFQPLLLTVYFALVKRGQWQRATDEGLERLRAAFA
jgi:uncharacterized protein YndB with AHSA1/START domain